MIAEGYHAWSQRAHPAQNVPADLINSPPHYTAGAIECLDAIESALGRDGFVAFLRGQVIKYNWRLGLKCPAAEDAGKAAFYANRLAKTLEEKQA